VASLGRRPGGNRDTVRDTAPRQFIFGDGAGGVERIRIDLSGPHLDHLRTVMDTTPDALRDGTPGAVVAADAHVPQIPEEDDEDPPSSDYADEQAEFDLAADFELGLTDEDQPKDPAASPQGNGNGTKAGNRGRVDA